MKLLKHESNSYVIPTGFEANASVTCPISLLFSGDYMYLNNDGSFDCNGTTDVMDVCSNSAEITFNYSSCSQRIAYSGRCFFFLFFFFYLFQRERERESERERERE